MNQINVYEPELYRLQLQSMCVRYYGNKVPNYAYR